MDQPPFTNISNHVDCTKSLQTASVRELPQMSTMLHTRLEAPQLSTRFSVSGCSSRRAAALSQKDAGNLLPVNTRTIVRFLATLELIKRAFLRGVLMEYLKSSVNDPSTDAMTSRKNTIFDAMYQEDYSDEIFLGL